MSELIVVDLDDVEDAAPVLYDTSAQAILDQAWSYLYSGVRVERDKLASGVAANATALTSTYSVPGLRGGAKVSIDLEDYHVWSVASAVATVQPGEFGSTSAAHDAGSIMHVNAEWTPFEIFTQINNELKSLSAPSNGLFRVRTVSLTYNPTFFGYDMTGVTNVDGILAVYGVTNGSDRDRYPITDFDVRRDLDLATFPSGVGLFTGRGSPGRQVLVSYRAPFDPLTALSQNVLTQTGLPFSAHDILAMGAALRCATPSEIDRNRMDSQGSGRRASEVPAGARLNAVRGLASLRQSRIVEEASRLSRMYPVRLPRRDR